TGGAQLVQGSTQAVLHITGSNLDNPLLQFQFQPGGITQAHNGYTPAPPSRDGTSGGTLVVNVDPDAAVGAYSIQARAGPVLSSTLSNISVTWRPQVNPTPSPTVLPQKLRAGQPNNQTVTITGHQLINASVTASGPAAPLVRVAVLAYPDDDTITVTLTI